MNALVSKIFRIIIPMLLLPVSCITLVSCRGIRPADFVFGHGGGCGDVALPQPPSDWTIPRLQMDFVWIPRLECWVGRYEVTNRQFRQFDPDHKTLARVWEDDEDSFFRRLPPEVLRSWPKYDLDGDDLPVAWVSPEQVFAFIEWLNTREQKAGRLPEGWVYRLPTGREFSGLCSCFRFFGVPWGDALTPPHGWNYLGRECPKYPPYYRPFDYAPNPSFEDDFPGTAPVKRSGRNLLGLYGVGGNVWEMTVEQRGGPLLGEGGQEETFEIFGRGGAWTSSSMRYNMNCRNKFYINPKMRSWDTGFRLVLARSWLHDIPIASRGVQGGGRIAPGSMPDEEPKTGREWTVPELRLHFTWVPRLGIWVGTQEVTERQYRYFQPDHVSRWQWRKSKQLVSEDRSQLPVTNVSLYDAVAFTRWLNFRERRAGRLPQGMRYRLLTNMEWDVAARCGVRGDYPWENPEVKMRANLNRSSADLEEAGPRPVQKTWKNQWGLQGFAGNVHEWVLGLMSSRWCHVCRGPAWDSLPSGHILPRAPWVTEDDVGFRVALDPFGGLSEEK